MARGKLTETEIAICFLEEYRDRWKKEYGRKPLSKTPAKTIKRIQETIKEVGWLATEHAMENYFTDESQWLTKNKHPLQVFLNQFDQYDKEAAKNGKGKNGIKRTRNFDVDAELEAERRRRSKNDN